LTNHASHELQHKLQPRFFFQLNIRLQLIFDYLHMDDITRLRINLILNQPRIGHAPEINPFLSTSLSISLVELNFLYHSKNITGQNYLFRRIINFYNTNQYIRPITKHIFTFHLFINLNWTLFYINLDKHEKV
jgi:hypothetical protein